MNYVQITALWLMMICLCGPIGACILNTERIKLKRESNEDFKIKSGQYLKCQNGSMLAGFLNTGAIPKAAPEEQNLADMELSNIANVQHMVKARQRVMDYNVNKKNEKQWVSVKRSYEQETKTITPECKLKVAKKSVLRFYNKILYEKRSAFTLNLTFPTLTSQRNVTSKSGTILSFQWA